MQPPDERRTARLTTHEAAVIRRWTLGTLFIGIAVVLAGPYTISSTDRIIALLIAATYATGAGVVRSPTGFRVILACMGFGAFALALQS